MNSVDPSIAQSIVFIENAVDVWNDLKDRFSQGDLVRISEIQQAIYALSQDSRSVTSFYSDLKTLWEELEIYMPIPNCTCPQRCSCNSMRLARHNHHLLQAMRFITGLNDSFNVVKTQILLMDPLPPMTKIFSMVLQFERQHSSVPNLDESNALVNASRGKSQNSGNSRPSNGRSGASSNGSNRSNRYCTYCHKTNHFVESCFEKNGVPPHMKNYNSSAHNAAAVEGGDHDDSAALQDTVTAPPPITQEQYAQLMSLLQSSTANHAPLATSN
jgi:hypothetical protein